MADFALITPSYGPDFERCRLLCESIDRWVEGHMTHYIVVDDAQDYRLFSQLANSRTQILHKRDILPAWIQRIPGVRKFWFSWRTRPIRGWIFQQLAKIATAEHMSEDVAIFVDSDTMFVRPVNLEQRFFRDGALRLYSEPGGNPESLTDHLQWHRNASALLGLAPTPMPAPDYVHNAVSWLGADVRRMCRHIEAHAGHSWVEAVASQWQFSEYILYGTYVERVLGADSGHYADPTKICLDYWTPKPMDDAQMRAFVAELRPEHIAVMLTAKAGMDVARHRQMLALVEARDREAAAHGPVTG